MSLAHQTVGTGPAPRSLVTVGIAASAVSANPNDELITYALGSCLGVMIHDDYAKVGGLLHVMLPSSAIDPDKAARNPAMFVDTGLPALFRACYELGAKKERMSVRVVGGANVTDHRAGDDMFQIGKRNFVMVRKLLLKNHVEIAAADVGGNVSRTVSLDVGSGTVSVKVGGEISVL